MNMNNYIYIIYITIISKLYIFLYIYRFPVISEMSFCVLKPSDEQLLEIAMERERERERERTDSRQTIETGSDWHCWYGLIC